MVRKKGWVGTIAAMLTVAMLIVPLQVTSEFIPNDKYWDGNPNPADDLQWGPEQVGANLAWDLTDENTLSNPGSDDIIVAIPDTGCNLAQEDLTSSAIWKNKDEYQGEHINDHYPGKRGLDDDGDFGIDFNDPQVGAFDGPDADNIPLWGSDGVADGVWDENLQVYVFPINPPSNDDQDEYELMRFDDDENGYWDDIYGWDFVQKLPYDMLTDVVDPGYTREDLTIYHGTHIAGSITGQINNNIGIAGIAQVRIMILRVLDQNGEIPDYQTGIEASALKVAMQYAIKNGADIISLSLGDPDQTNTLIDDEISLCKNSGIIIVCGAGDILDPLTDDPWVCYPACKDGVISVGATYPEGYDNDYHRAWYSCYGPSTDMLDVVAPGGEGIRPYTEDNIFSTYGPNINSYDEMSGTSSAAPYVSGIIGLMMTYHEDLTIDRITQVLKSTATDINPGPGPRKDIYSRIIPPINYKTDYGRDYPTGWGEVDAMMALGYSNYMKNQWSERKLFTSNVLADESKQPSIMVDSEGYSHIVFIDNNDEIRYMSIDPAGRIWKDPFSLENGNLPNPSYFPDLYIDCDDNIHVCWLEHVGQNRDDIYYMKLKTDGTILIGPLQLTNQNNANSREYLNIVTNLNWLPTIIYAEKHNDWDIYQMNSDILGRWIGPTALVNAANDQRKPSADIGESNNANYIYCVYQELTGNNNWDIWVWTNFGVAPSNWKIKSSVGGLNLKEPTPTIAVAYRSMAVYITWAEDPDCIMLHTFDGLDANHVPKVYGYNPALPLTTENIRVGEGLHSKVAFPKLSLSYISNSHARTNARDLIQIDIVWRERDNNGNWWLALSEVTQDGRSLTVHNQRYIRIFGENNLQAISSSQLRSTTRSNWLDSDGNFRLITVEDLTGSPAIGKLYFYSTRERWESVSNVGNGNVALVKPQIANDSMNGLHLVFEDDSNLNGLYTIWYAYYNGWTRPPQQPTMGPVRISDVGFRSCSPKISYITSPWIGSPIIRITYVRWIGPFSSQARFVEVNSINGNIIKDEPVPVSNDFLGNIPDISVVPDFSKGRIIYAWSEFESGRGYEIHIAVTTCENEPIQSETSSLVEGSSGDDINPAMDIDYSDGTIYIVYERSTFKDVYLNGFYWNEQSSSYVRSLGNDIKINDRLQPEDAMDPSIKIDQTIHRRTENNINQDKTSKTNHFQHVVYCRTLPGTNKYNLMYTKWTKHNVYDTIIEEKDITSLGPNRNVYYSDVPIKGRIILDQSNRVSIVYYGKMHHGANWPPLQNHYAVFFTKLDNNGEILTSETHISYDPNRDSMRPIALYDKNDEINIVWEYNSVNGWTLMFSMQNIFFR
jgi:hypothetical protein